MCMEEARSALEPQSKSSDPTLRKSTRGAALRAAREGARHHQMVLAVGDGPHEDGERALAGDLVPKRTQAPGWEGGH